MLSTPGKLFWICLSFVGFHCLTTIASGREWKGRTGSSTIEAEFLGWKDGQAVLQRAKANTIPVSLEFLSAEDQAYLTGKVEKLTAPRELEHIFAGSYSDSESRAKQWNGIIAPRGVYIPNRGYVAAPISAQDDPEARVWHVRKGAAWQPIKARFLRSEGGTIYLGQGEKEIRVRINALSQDDRRQVQYILEAQANRKAQDESARKQQSSLPSRKAKSLIGARVSAARASQDASEAAGFHRRFVALLPCSALAPTGDVDLSERHVVFDGPKQFAHRNPILDVQISGDGRFAISRTARALKVWDIVDQKLVKAIHAHSKKGLEIAAISPHGKFVAWVENSVAFAAGVGDSTEAQAIGAANFVSFGANDGQLLIGAGGLEKGTIQQWSLPDFEKTNEIGSIYPLFAASDVTGTKVVALADGWDNGERPGHLILWSLPRNQLLHAYQWDCPTVHQADAKIKYLSKRSQWAVLGADLELYDADATPLYRIMLSDAERETAWIDGVSDVACQGDVFITTEAGNVVNLRSLDDGRLLATFTARVHVAGRDSIAISPDGRSYVVGDSMGRLHIRCFRHEHTELVLVDEEVRTPDYEESGIVYRETRAGPFIKGTDYQSLPRTYFDVVRVPKTSVNNYVGQTGRGTSSGGATRTMTSTIIIRH